MPTLTFPTLSSGSVCLYPLGRTVSAKTRVLRYADDSEKRFRVGSPLNGFALTYSSLSATDRDSIITLHQQTQGSKDATWTFPLPVGGVTTNYTNMQFEVDELTWVRQVNNRYQMTFRIRQTVQSETIGSLGAFPSTRQAPYTEGQAYETVANVLDSGAVYTWANRALPRRTVNVSLPYINETELAAHLAHFIAAGGQWRPFNFTSPNDNATILMRYAQDQIEARYAAPRYCSLSVRLEQVPA